MKHLLLLVAVSLAAGAAFTSEDGVLKLNGNRFYLKGLSWFGCETSLATFHGLWAVDYNFLLDFMVQNKFNAMRVPFALDNVLNDPMPTSISFGYCNNNVSCNLDLKGLTALQVLDKVIAAAGQRGIVIMLDMHSFEPDAFMANGLWYDATHSEALVLQGWDKLTARYKNYSNVFAADVKNEPFSTTWNVGDNSTDWNAAVGRIGNHIIAASDWLVFAEGTAGSPPCKDACFWGENLQGVATAPIKLSAANRLVYSPHCYGPDVAPQNYFNDPTFPANMPSIWQTHYGFIRDMKQNAVVVGEWGGHTAGADGVWLNAYISWLLSKDMTDTFFWCLNPDSGDTGGLLLDDWVTPVTDKLAMLNTLVPNPSVFKP